VKQHVLEPFKCKTKQKNLTKTPQTGESKQTLHLDRGYYTDILNDVPSQAKGKETTDIGERWKEAK